MMGILVVGMGIAGRVRARDLAANLIPGARLVGVCSRRRVSIVDVVQLDIDEALQREDVHCVMICTENEMHESYARKAIQAGKHVLVEFPMARSHAAAVDLVQLAAEKKVALYEESIALLTDDHLKMKLALEFDNKVVVDGEIRLEGKFNGWIEDFSRSGSPYHSSISLIHQILDLFGELVPYHARIIRAEDAICVHANVRISNGAPFCLRVHRARDATRRLKTMRLQFDDGTTFLSPIPRGLRLSKSYAPSLTGESTVTKVQSSTSSGKSKGNQKKKKTVKIEAESDPKKETHVSREVVRMSQKAMMSPEPAEPSDLLLRTNSDDTNANSPKPGLFAQDTILFVETIKSKKLIPPNRSITMRALQVADQLAALAGLNFDASGVPPPNGQ